MASRNVHGGEKRPLWADKTIQHPSVAARPTPAFTIVELLIVVVIIAILAAITIVAYNGIQQRARATAVSAALNQVAKKVTQYSIENGTYPVTLAAAGITDGAVTYQYTATTASFCVTGTQATTSQYISDTTPTPTSGGCPGHGQGGAGAVTNLVTNPSFETGISGWTINSGGFTGTGGGSNLNEGYSGTHGYRYTVSTGGTMTSLGIYTQVMNLSETESYVLSVYARSNVSVGYSMRAERRNSLNTNIGTVTGSAVTLNSNWQRLSVAVSPTATMDHLTMAIYSSGGTTLNVGDTIDFDAAMLTKGSAVYNYADGNSSNWVWNGTANASTSTGPAL